MTSLIYLDNNATTPLDPGVLDVMMPYFTTHFGNASSISHRAGRLASAAVETARTEVAALIGASEKEITFTSGATEAINMALKGIYHSYQRKGKHIITCQTEHRAVLDVCSHLQKLGAAVTFLPVDSQGRIQLSDLEAAIRPDTILIALMYANNETGVIHPVADIGRLAKERDVLFFCDATQAAGKIKVDVVRDEIDLLCLSAHKLYGPKGTGALYIKRKSRRIQTGTLLHGGGQENGLRGGTLNVPAIAAFGKAADICRQTLDTDHRQLRTLRDQLEQQLTSAIPEVYINGTESPRLPNTSNICFRYLNGEEIMVNMPSVALAAGSACASGKREPSHVLHAMGLPAEDIKASLRFSFGRFNSQSDVGEVVNILPEMISRLRAASPVWQLHKEGLL